MYRQTPLWVSQPEQSTSTVLFCPLSALYMYIHVFSKRFSCLTVWGNGTCGAFSFHWLSCQASRWQRYVFELSDLNSNEIKLYQLSEPLLNLLYFIYTAWRILFRYHAIRTNFSAYLHLLSYMVTFSNCWTKYLTMIWIWLMNARTDYCDSLYKAR